MKDAGGRNGRLAVVEEEAKLIRLIFDKYAHTRMGCSGVAGWLNRNGCRRPVPVNGKHSVFTDLTVKGILSNPVYTGRIVHGRYGTEKIKGERNESRRVVRDQYETYDGLHEAIISEELWEEVQAKRQATAGKPQEHFGPKHVHVLSTIVLCPECGFPMYGNSSGRKKDASGAVSPPIFYYSCKHAKRNTGRDCAYTHSIRQDILDRQVIQIVQQAVDSMYVEKGLIMALGSSDDLEELTANRDNLLADKRKAEKKKARLLDEIERLDADSDAYAATFRDLQRILQRHNESIAGLEEQVEEAEIRIRSARDGAASFDETLRIFHKAMGSIESWPAGQLRAFMRSFLGHVEIFPKALPDGQLVRRIRFKFPVSVDGGLTYSDIVDLDPGDGIPPDDDPPPGGGGGTPGPEGPLPDNGVFLTEDLLPNPNVLVTA